MARPRTDPIWQERVSALLGENRSLNGAEIRRRLINDERLRLGLKKKATGVPSERKIRELVVAHKNKSAQEQSQYELFHWPASMGLEGLPHEAARACLDLVAHIDNERQGEYQAPRIRLVREFWRATQAAPDADVQTRLEIAAHLIFKKAEGLERYLAHRGWLKGEKPPPLCFTEEELWRGDTFDILASTYRMLPETRREAAERKTKEQGGK